MAQGFTYTPFDANTIVPSIAALIARQNDPYAQAAQNIAAVNARAMDSAAAGRAEAARASGDIWGRTIQQVGQIPSQVIAQQRAEADAAQKRALVGTEITKNTLANTETERQQAGLSMLPSLIAQYTDPTTGTVTPEGHAGIAHDLDAAGYPDAAEKWLKHSADSASSIDTIRTADAQPKIARAVAIAKAAQAASDPGDFKARLGQLVIGGALDPKNAQEVATLAEQAGPDGWPQLKKSYIDTGDQLTPHLTVKKDETIAQGISGTPFLTGPTVDANEAELAQTVNDPKKSPAERQKAVDALKTLRDQKNPPSIDDQLLKAISAGDTTTRDNILATLKSAADARKDPAAAAQLAAIRNLTMQEAQARLDARDTSSPQNQQKFEQEYRTVLQRGLSSRSGGLGMEDAKVQQANHLTTLMDQFYDPKTGQWNIPRVQMNELALGLARLTAPGGQAGEGMLREFQQRTAKGDVAGALTYLTGQAVPTNTQDLTQVLKDSIVRQGKTAEQNREGEMSYLRGLAPTDLAEDRRQKLEATSLNPLRQSQVVTNAKGERKLIVSTDGGKTWQ